MPIAWIPDLGPVAIALAAVIVTLGTYVIAKLVSRIGGSFPLIGNWMAANIYGLIMSVVSADKWIYEKSMGALSTVIQAIDNFLYYVPQRTLITAQHVMSAIEHTAWTIVPRAVAAAYTYAHGLYQSLHDYAYNIYVDAKGFAASAESAAIAEAKSLYSSAIGYVNKEIPIVKAFAEGLNATAVALISQINSQLTARIAEVAGAALSEIGALKQYVVSLVATEVNTLESEIVAVETKITALAQQYAAAAEKDAIHAVDLTGAAALVNVWPGIITDVDELIKSIPQDLIDIRDEIATIPRAIPGDLAGALAALGAIAIPLLRYLRECGVPMCHDLSGLSNMLNDLSSAASSAALLGLFTLAVTDPQGAADVIDSVVGPVAHGAATVTRDLIGV